MAITTIDATTALSNNGMTLLNTTTVSSAVANVSFSSSLITDTYMDYRVTIRFYAPSTNGQSLFVFPSDDNGSTYDIFIEQHMTYADLMFIGLRQTTGFKAMYFSCHNAHDNDGGHNTGNDYWWTGGSKIVGSSNSDRTAINNLKFQAGSGNIAQGTFSLYGIKSA